MKEIGLEEAPQRARDLFNKGFAALERGSVDYAIDLLTACVRTSPDFLQARKFLRAAEIRKFRERHGKGAVGHLLPMLTGLPLYARAWILLGNGRADEALDAAERLMRIDPLNLRFISLLARAGRAAGMAEVGLQTVEMVREHFPADVELFKLLGSLYRDAGRVREARQVFEKLCDRFPNDPALVKALKDAMAMESMHGDGWAEEPAKGEDYRRLIRDVRQAELLEQESKAVKTDRDADALIVEHLAKIEAEPENVNYYRALARLYVLRERMDDAIALLERAQEISHGDPEVDAAITRTRVQKMDMEIARLREQGDEATAAAREQARDTFIFEDTRRRVERYPNDLVLRYEWGALLLDSDDINDAIQQFQLSQRSPQRRVKSLYALGVCFERKKQYDLAAEQLKRALEELPGMDDTKKDVLYELGRIAELMGDAAAAVDYFKQIYQVDITYRDVAQKIEKAYAQNEPG